MISGGIYHTLSPKRALFRSRTFVSRDSPCLLRCGEFYVDHATIQHRLVQLGGPAEERSGGVNSRKAHPFDLSFCAGPPAIDLGVGGEQSVEDL